MYVMEGKEMYSKLGKGVREKRKEDLIETLRGKAKRQNARRIFILTSSVLSLLTDKEICVARPVTKNP